MRTCLTSDLQSQQITQEILELHNSNFCHMSFNIHRTGFKSVKVSILDTVDNLRNMYLNQSRLAEAEVIY